MHSNKINKKYRKRLFVGEGNFSFTKAFLDKHQQKPDLAYLITATELQNEESVKQDLLEEGGVEAVKQFIKTLEEIKQKGVHCAFEIDGTKIRDYNTLVYTHKRFERIHFNFPHNRKEFTTGELQDFIKRFFCSSSSVQLPGDKIHLVLPKGDREKYYQCYYGVYEASVSSGYKLIKKRPFTSTDKGNRYVGYYHKQTSGNTKVAASNDGREYVFEKLDQQTLDLFREECRYKTERITIEARKYSKNHKYLESIDEMLTEMDNDASSTYSTQDDSSCDDFEKDKAQVLFHSTSKIGVGSSSSSSYEKEPDELTDNLGVSSSMIANDDPVTLYKRGFNSLSQSEKYGEHNGFESLVEFEPFTKLIEIIEELSRYNELAEATDKLEINFNDAEEKTPKCSFRPYQ